MAHSTFTLTGKHTSPSGTAHSGTVKVTPNAVIRDVAGAVVMAGPDIVKLDASGAWSLVLPCDSPGLNPATGIGFTVEYLFRAESLEPQSFYATADLAGSTLDATGLVTVSVATPLSAIVGPQGDPGPQGNPGPTGPSSDQRPFTGRSLQLASRATVPFDILGIGDSLFSGQAVSTIGARWPSRMVEHLRAKLPSGAVGALGYIPASYAHASPANPWTFTGNTLADARFGLGKSGRILGPNAGSGAGTGTATITCSSFKLVMYQSATGQSVSVTIDGGAPITVNLGNSPLYQTWTSPALTPGSHTITVACASTTTTILLGVMTYNGDEAKGIRYWDGAQSGSRADLYNAADGGESRWADSIGPVVSPSLIIADWMTNDYVNRTPAQYQVSIGNVLTLLRSKTAAPIIWVAPYERLSTGFGGATWQQYVDALMAATGSDAASSVFDVRTFVPRLSPDTYGALADGLHPSDKLAAYLGDQLAEHILTTWAAAA